MYRCAQNCCVILHDWCTGVRSCTGLWKVCSGGAEGEDLALRGGVVGDVSDETLSAPPSYHSSLPPYIPRSDPSGSRRLRNQEARLTALRGALSEVRQPGSDSWERRQALRHNMRQINQNYDTSMMRDRPPLPPVYRPPPRYTEPPLPQYSGSQLQTTAPPEYTDIDMSQREIVSQIRQNESAQSAESLSDPVRQLGRDIP